MINPNHKLIDSLAGHLLKDVTSDGVTIPMGTAVVVETMAVKTDPTNVFIMVTSINKQVQLPYCAPSSIACPITNQIGR